MDGEVRRLRAYQVEVDVVVDVLARAGDVERCAMVNAGAHERQPGGDRDRAKRPLMGESAGQGSDFVLLTSDNPRSEDPLAIINDALVGLQRSGVKYKMEPDRKAAIALAIHEARPGDIVLLAGKGHEKVQVTQKGSIPFDDVEIAQRILRESGYDCEAANAAAGRNP